MDVSFEKKYHELEGRHWWFVGRRDFIGRLLKKEPKDSAILDIGCSGGPLMKFLSENKFRNIFGIDTSQSAIDLCKSRGIANVLVKDATNTQFEAETFNIVIASDVLEHIKEERAALAEWQRILKKGGKLIIFVPAFNFLWSAHDTANHHFRRYTNTQLSVLLKECGFEIIRSSYWNFFLFFPASLVRLTKRLLPENKVQAHDELNLLPFLINYFLICLLKLENWLAAKINLPVGVSVFVVARKKD